MTGLGLTPTRLRLWIVVIAGLLITAIAAFLLYGRWQNRRQSVDLPDRLSKTIQQSTQGFTYSESHGGHTIFTLHAAKAVQFKAGGHAELHDVSITLYSAQGAPANRVYGNAFDWDPVHGVARAIGEVQIDFQQAPAASEASDTPPAGKTQDGDGDSRGTVHIKTSGLVFNKQTGLATTAEKLEFRLAQAAGSATGASFDSQRGVIVLLADVAFNSSAGGNPLTVHAHHAQFDRDNHLLYLLQEATDYGDSHSSSDQATVSFRSDGSAFAVEAEGKVILAGSDGQQVRTRKMHLDLGANSEPQQAQVDGGVLYVADNAIRLLHGSASSGTMSFGPKMTIRHAQLRDAVSLVDEEKFPSRNRDAVKGKEDKPEAATRQLGATKVDIDFAADTGSGADHTPQIEHILAVGSARMNVHELFAKTPPKDTTVQGDQLFATLNGDESLSSLRATGHTSLAVVSPTGAKQTSQGDSLLLSFMPAAGKAQGKHPAAAPQPAAQLQSAVQTGNVTLVQEVAAGAKATAATTVNADRAAYDATTEVVQLSGNPRIKDANGELDATNIEVARLTGDANATGGVKATYRQASGKQGLSFGGAGPVHIVADHAHLDHGKNLTTFFGTAQEQSRMWQGSDSIAAPVLELSQIESTLSAHGGTGEAVHAVFTNTPGSTSHALPGRTTGPAVVRLQSKTLVYAENEQKAVFTGGVVAQTPNGVLRSSAMDIYLSHPAAAPTAATPPAPAQEKQSSRGVSRILAHGGVVLQQPGRKGVGEQLDYTAQDGKFVLTGTSASPPRLTDDVRGTVTGAALIFNDRDDSVVVDGGATRAATQTHVAR